MKGFAIVVVIGAVLWACNSPEQAHTSTTERVLPRLTKGYYLNVAYVEALKRSGSPREAQQHCDVCLLVIEGEKADRGYIMYSMHMASEPLDFKPHQGRWMVRTNEDEATPVTLGTLTIEGDSLAFAGQHFVPFKRIGDPLRIDQLRMPEELFFGGIYETEDRQRIEFKESGEVATWRGYVRYTISVDSFDPPVLYDRIGFSADAVPGPNDWEWFAFTWVDGLLSIHELLCEQPLPTGKCAAYTPGKRVLEARRK